MLIHEKNHDLLKQYREQSEIVNKEKQKLKDLNIQILALRENCMHDFEPPHKDYVHEGRVCKICGINEMVAILNKTGIIDARKY